jgi:hypothetical protein
MGGFVIDFSGATIKDLAVEESATSKEHVASLRSEPVTLVGELQNIPGSTPLNGDQLLAESSPELREARQPTSISPIRDAEMELSSTNSAEKSSNRRHPQTTVLLEGSNDLNFNDDQYMQERSAKNELEEFANLELKEILRCKG